MVLGAYPRRRNELLAPFSTDGQFCSLICRGDTSLFCQAFSTVA
jgi:hypothetical protein